MRLRRLLKRKQVKRRRRRSRRRMKFWRLIVVHVWTNFSIDHWWDQRSDERRERRDRDGAPEAVVRLVPKRKFVIFSKLKNDADVKQVRKRCNLIPEKGQSCWASPYRIDIAILVRRYWNLLKHEFISSSDPSGLCFRYPQGLNIAILASTSRAFSTTEETTPASYHPVLDSPRSSSPLSNFIPFVPPKQPPNTDPNPSQYVLFELKKLTWMMTKVRWYRASILEMMPPKSFCSTLMTVLTMRMKAWIPKMAVSQLSINPQNLLQRVDDLVKYQARTRIGAAQRSETNRRIGGLRTQKSVVKSWDVSLV